MKKPSTLCMLAVALLLSFNSFSIPKLNSFPSAQATIFLDFDGHYVHTSMWNSGTPINCAPAGLSDVQITEAFNRVAEDYRPFNINITTDSTVFLLAPLDKRVRVIVTPTSAWCPGVGGISYIGSFSVGDDIPSFVFSDRLGYNAKMVGECCSHESGHSVGLDHQSKYAVGDCITPTQQYHTGFGNGEIAWAPIMGNSYGRNMSNWNNGPTPYGCTNTQDNLSIIVSQNGFGYRTDDYTETMNAGTFNIPVGSFSISGVITTNTDKDAFKYVLPHNSNIHLTATPYSVGALNSGANLDIQLSLYNAAGVLIKTYDDPAAMNVTIDTILVSGTYYIVAEGAGNVNTAAYGSLGSYTLSGTSGTLPIHDISLTGTSDNKGQHILNWKILADDPIKTVIVETSGDGINFTPLASVAPASVKYSHTSFLNSTVFYRLNVTSVRDEKAYSNTVAINSPASTDKSFIVSTLVQSEIMVNAPGNFQYLVCDMNGRIINKGTGVKGTNKINIASQQKGMYIIQLFNNDKRQTERVIKQ